MNIKTKFKVNDVVFFMKDNRIETGVISTIEIQLLCGSKKNNEDTPEYDVKESYGLFTGFAATKSCDKTPGSLFASREELIENLFK